MKQIDGATGGGQVLRLAVGLAALEHTPIEIQNVRGGRETPGLRPQHVAAVEAVAELADAKYDGVTVGSETITFEPGAKIGGETTVTIETAGSITLIFDAVLPLGLAAVEPIQLHATGGTDVKWSPPLDYLRHVKLPFLGDFGLDASLENIERGFYPAGGGSATLEIAPTTVEPIDCTDRGALESIDIYSISSAVLADANVPARQVEGATETIHDEFDVPINDARKTVDTLSTGTVIVVIGNYEQSRAGFSALGEPGWPAEEVGEAAAESFLQFHSTTAAVDVHLADQLLPFVALQGGAITSTRMTDHIESALSVLDTFGKSIDVEEDEDRVRISGSGPD